ncbi:hypothetical protein DXG01_011727 [Tephrocybe rancida]|nr:hypothetical protein DXG01_011727 [Tephrocybe rancida]
MTPKGIKWQRGRRSRSLAQSTTSTSTETSEGLNIAQSNLNAMLELQRVSYLFQGTSFISEAEFVINCKVVMNLLQYPHSDVNSQQQALLVEVIEVRIFIGRIV